MVPKKQEWNIIVPDIFVAENNKSKKLPSNAITLENLAKLGPIVGVNSQRVIEYYLIVAIILLYGSQLKINAKLQYDKSSKTLSPEKVFQQTMSHYILTRLLSNSSQARTIYVLYALQIGIDRDAFGNIEEERTEEGFHEALCDTFDELLNSKGSGSSKVSIKNIDTRTEALRAIVASIRSKLCAAPTYGYNKITTLGQNLKKVNKKELQEFVDRFVDKMVKVGLVQDSMKNSLHLPVLMGRIRDTLAELNIETDVDDSAFGTFNECPIESEVLGLTRNLGTTQSPISKEPLPEFINLMKSSKLNLKKKN